MCTSDFDAQPTISVEPARPLPLRYVAMATAVASESSASNVVGHVTTWDFGGLTQPPTTSSSSAALAAADVVARVVSGELHPVHEPMLSSVAANGSQHPTLLTTVQFPPEFVVQNHEFGPQATARNGKGKCQLCSC